MNVYLSVIPVGNRTRRSRKKNFIGNLKLHKIGLIWTSAQLELSLRRIVKGEYEA